MPTHKSSDYKLSAVKYYLSHLKNQVQTCKIFGLSQRFKYLLIYTSNNSSFNFSGITHPLPSAPGSDVGS